MKKFLLFVFVFFAFSFKVFAAHLDLYRINNVYSSQLDMDTGSYYSYRQNRYIMDGRTVYCVEPGVDITTREYLIYDLSYSNFSSDILNKLSLIGYFGYDYPGHQNDNYFLATQELVWELVGNNEAHFTTGINNTGDYINIDYEKNEIMRLVNDYYLKPSFDDSVFDVIVGDKLVLTDDNHVLSNYDVISGDAYIDGDNLIVDVSSNGYYDIKLLRKKYDNYESVFYEAHGSQNFMFLRAPQVFSSIGINVYIPYSNVSIYKTGDVLVDYTGDFVYEERGLDNVSFGLYSGDDIYVNGELVYNSGDLVEELVTSNGYALSHNIPNGKYYLKELNTYDDLVLSDDIYFELNNDSSQVFTYEVNLKNKRKKVFIDINKKGEVIDGNYKGLGGVKVGLYSHDDIYSYDNRLLVSKDKLIDTFVTDFDGRVFINVDLPISSYYFKELETLDFYVLDDSVHDIDMDMNIESISYTSDIVNYLKRGNVVINKCDIYGNRLDGAGFELYRGDELIYEGSTFGGNIRINNLPYGEYKLYEVSAPDGFIKTDLVYDILLDSSIVGVDVYNEKLPITSDIYFSRRLCSYICIIFGLVILRDKKIKDI